MSTDGAMTSVLLGLLGLCGPVLAGGRGGPLREEVRVRLLGWALRDARPALWSLQAR